METFRLLLFTTIWTAIWAAPLPKLSRRVELLAGLIPFAAFGLRVFGACFIGVPAHSGKRPSSARISRMSRIRPTKPPPAPRTVLPLRKP